VIRLLRRGWRRLISMRTALVLLFLLAVAAVPGSLLPQRPLNPTKVDSYLATHGGWGRLLDRLGMFDVFGSAWFAAIYLLLFVSLIGCLVPRIRQHARAVRARPLPAPKNLSRLPESGQFEAAAAPGQLAEQASAALGRRWRLVRRSEPGGAVTVSAEKGYLRETGNLIFHVALLSALVLIAVGRLFSYQGNVIVREGQGFCNSTTSYDSWRPGRLAAEGRITPAPFCVDSLDRFTAQYLPDGEPSKFIADVTYSRGTDGHPEHARITVNHPLRFEGDRVYLIGHGYAPRVTVHMPDGSTRTDTMPFLPTAPATLLSEGAFKEFGKAGADQDIGIEGFFAPTPLDDGTGVITSSSPKADHPVLGVFIYQGKIDKNNVPQSVYSLDTTSMRKIGQANLAVGQSVKLPGGVSVSFDGWVNWASIQVSHDPTQGYLLLAAIAMVLGLLGSLTIRRRRIWLRLTPGSADTDGSPTVVTMGGLARSDTGNFTTEFAQLFGRLRQAMSPPTERIPVGAGRE
jgi:cytochrome c biogenesis protein